MNTRQLFELRKEAYTNGYMQTNPDGDVNAYINDVIMGSNTVFADYEFDAYNNNKNYDWLDADEPYWSTTQSCSKSFEWQ